MHRKKNKNNTWYSNNSNRYNQIMSELSDKKIVAILGGEPTYIHSNVVYAQKGMETVGALMQETLEKKAKNTQTKIKQFIKILDIKEQSFYQSTNGLISDFNSMQKYWNAFTKQNPNKGFQEYFNLLLTLRDLAVLAQYNTGESQQKYLQDFKKSLDQALKTTNKKTFEKLKHVNPDVFAYFSNAVAEENGQLKLKIPLKNIAAKLGYHLEDVMMLGSELFARTNSYQDIANTVGNTVLNSLDTSTKNKSKKPKLKSAAAERTGNTKHGQGASDFSLVIGSASIGISAKFSRVFDDKNKNSVYVSSTGSTNQNISSFFKDENRSFDISDIEWKYINYGLVNFKNFEPMPNSDTFMTSLKYLIAWDRVLKFLLGEKFNLTTVDNAAKTELPVFIATGSELLKMKDSLNKFVAISPNQIYSFINWAYSFHSLLKKQPITDKDSLFDAKRRYLYWTRKSKKQPSYKGLYNDQDVQAILNEYNIDDCKISVSYRMIFDNIKHSY